MAKFVLTNARPFINGTDLTSASNKFEVEFEVADVDSTNFGSGGATELLGGLGSSSITGEGQWDAGDISLVDDALWAATGSGVGPWTLAPAGAADGAFAWLGRVHEASYKLGGEVGAVAPWSLSGKGSGLFARGVIAHPPGIARTASGVGTAINLGAVAANRYLVASVHVLSVTGTLSITPRIETDDASGFASATTVLTGTAAVAASTGTGQWLATTGTAITDTWQRAAWTTSGTGSALFVVSLGIA